MGYPYDSQDDGIIQFTARRGENVVVLQFSDGLTLPELAEQFQQFALALGYHPQSVTELFAEDI